MNLLIDKFIFNKSVMSQEPRAPTPAVYRPSPLYDIYGGTLHPYVNHKLGGITPYLSIFSLIKLHLREPSLLSIRLPFNKFQLPIVLDLLTSLERDGGCQMYNFDYKAISKQSYSVVPLQ
jgi:hypothetical protein